MLTHLAIKGLAIIEELSIDFSPQLNVITGETGAGKSILIKALNLVLGGKAQADLVRSGWDKATISAIFELNADHPFFLKAKDSGLDIGKGPVIIRRHVGKKGRSQAWICDTPVTQGLLKSLGVLLIDIFGQHDNHLLLDSQNHGSYVDQFLPKPTLLMDYQKNYQNVVDSFRELRQLIGKYQSKVRDRDYFEYRLRELEDFDPTTDEFHEVTAAIDRSKSEILQKQALTEAEQTVDYSFSGGALSQAFRLICESLSRAPQNQEIEYLSRLSSELEESINDFSYELGKCISNLDLDEATIQHHQHRLAKYKDLFKKFNVDSAEGLLQAKTKVAEDLSFIEQAEAEVMLRLKNLLQETEALMSLAQRLRKTRISTFEKISKRIKQELQQLNMKGAELCLDMEPLSHPLLTWEDDLLSDELKTDIATVAERLTLLGPDGLDKIQFLLRSNLGEEARPLAKIASGGEVARIMLGIKKVLSADAQTCVMVFDEIDTGISGQTASIVGKKLAEISKRFQVICISHLPQVAVFGDSHFKVSKKVDEGRTESKIVRLSSKKSLEEVARLLSAGKITKSSLDNAKSLRQEILGL